MVCKKGKEEVKEWTVKEMSGRIQCGEG